VGPVLVKPHSVEKKLAAVIDAATCICLVSTNYDTCHRQIPGIIDATFSVADEHRFDGSGHAGLDRKHRTLLVAVHKRVLSARAEVESTCALDYESF
jgi:hypothetical protein